MKPSLVFQVASSDARDAFCRGLGDVRGVTAVASTPQDFWVRPGLDAMYSSFPAAERWGARPLPLHQAGVLATRPEDRARGMPPRIIVGLVVTKEETNSLALAMPVLIDAVCGAAAAHGIATVGILEHSLTFDPVTNRRAVLDWAEVGQMVASAYQASCGGAE